MKKPVNPRPVLSNNPNQPVRPPRVLDEASLGHVRGGVAGVKDHSV